MTTDAFDHFDHEAARIDAFYTALEPGGWNAPTRCAGWDRKDLLAHLCGIEDYAEAGLDGTVAEHARHDGQELGYEDLNEARVTALRPLSTGELLAKWRAQVARIHPELRARGGDATIDTHAGPYPLGRQVFYFASELAVHADDAGVPVTEDERSDRDAWRVWFALDALQEVSPDVEANGADGVFTVRLGEESAELTAADLVEAAARRLPEGRLPEALGRALVVLA
ncbi:maleylpyruvate isomerase family mycothiol-dependent enzyme [Phytomonospora sp. NPDC050363]|uniref:maleylpyruvate isomerase family mycothiol-dependent enzyme n=1 Tax=Phytomonospora sp. NPDC050363 TaxID=3155642 RepID=UPI0033F606C7